MKNPLNSDYNGKIKYRHRQCLASKIDYSNDIEFKGVIPLEFTIKLPPPRKRGIDYGFKKGDNWIITKN